MAKQPPKTQGLGESQPETKPAKAKPDAPAAKGKGLGESQPEVEGPLSIEDQIDALKAEEAGFADPYAPLKPLIDARSAFFKQKQETERAWPKQQAECETAILRARPACEAEHNRQSGIQVKRRALEAELAKQQEEERNHRLLNPTPPEADTDNT